VSWGKKKELKQHPSISELPISHGGGGLGEKCSAYTLTRKEKKKEGTDWKVKKAKKTTVGDRDGGKHRRVAALMGRGRNHGQPHKGGKKAVYFSLEEGRGGVSKMKRGTRWGSDPEPPDLLQGVASAPTMSHDLNPKSVPGGEKAIELFLKNGGGRRQMDFNWGGKKKVLTKSLVHGDIYAAGADLNGEWFRCHKEIEKRLPVPLLKKGEDL